MAYQYGRRYSGGGNFRGRGGYKQRAPRRRQQSQGATVATSGLFRSKNDPGLYVGTFRGEWFWRLLDTIQEAEKSGGAVVFLRKNVDDGNGIAWRVTIAPDNNDSQGSYGRRSPQSNRPAPVADEGDGDPDAEEWTDDTADGQ